MDAFLGEIRIWPGVKAPTGWVICDGRTLNINDYQALYSLIGTTYGGDGRTTFAVPNLVGRLPIHQGTGTNLTPRALGQTGGAMTVTLTEANMPKHTHVVSGVAVAASASTPANNMLATACSGYLGYEETGHGETIVTMNPGALTTDGGAGQPHSNQMPNIALYYVMCVNNGIYPTQN